MQYLEEKVQDIESVQKTILLRLDNIEKLIQSQELEKRTYGCQDEHSWQPQDDNFNDHEYWQSHAYYSSEYSPSTYSQSYQPQLTSPLTNAHPQYAPSLANSQPQYAPSSQLQHPPQFSSPLVSPQPQFGSQFTTTQPS